ncbi:alpha/beta fold hydrolase [Planomonospora venezuelensis]|uniref:Pimeloyl-ACP methyl ester carboxylesterase/nucleoside-diphosphate-sugar epimerase n=1 Tax=Planomonospora venezuelensis TaxID=1999 RepID=A0A841D4F8_PLAVE|nr:alpha/beta fold hydrolase [Planomonospora venezuelensis]MBB5965131.1 pimeloyl-ACP methyl ester carboxylesterase/nucleoside-diphosphate-sugar epimerase [Planomonospora venezuelensis]
MTPDSIVFGAAGFVGRSLVAELLRRGRRVAAAVRGPGDRLTSWLAAQGADTAGLAVVTADITVPGLGLTGLDGVRDVYNAAARFAFGLSAAEARLANVTGAVNVADWAAARPGLRRLVHVSGYRVSGAEADYRRLGAYEASKGEGDAAVRVRARELGLPLTIANPATVIGPGQFIGLASLVRDLWLGRLPALPGGPGVFVPVVDVGYLARFMAALPEDEETAGRAYWVLDDETPELPELVALLADHLGVPAPRRSIPVGLVRRLPRALTGADPETLSFVSADRYDTAPALAFAERAGLRMPPVRRALRSWADDLVAARFGAAPARNAGPAGREPYGTGGTAGSRAAGPARPYGFRDVAGVRTWVTGARETPGYVLLHGLPLDADSWAETAARLDDSVLAPDLPGLGRSAPLPSGRPLRARGGTGPGRAPAADGTDGWLAELLRPVATRPLLVGHSFGCGPALRYAAAHPDRIAGLVLVAPAFLQEPSGWFSRSRLAVPVLRRMPRERLGQRVGVPPEAPADLRRPGAARRVVGAMRAAHARRAELRLLLDRVRVPVTIVAGEHDPLAVDRPAVVIGGAGHCPQLTHPDELAGVLAEVRASTLSGGRPRGDGAGGSR